MSGLEAVLVLLAGMAAGTVNAIVGSGTLITFPVLLAVGYSPVVANVSNTVGLAPGSISAAFGYRAELVGQGQRLKVLGLASLAGGITGGVLLLTLPEDAFRAIVPVLIALSCVLVLVQPWLTTRLAMAERRREHGGVALFVGVFLAGVYGGYFGAAQGVLLIALLGLFLDEHLQRVNAAKNVLAGIVNGVAAVLFILVSHVAWSAATPDRGGVGHRRPDRRAHRPAHPTGHPARSGRAGRHRRDRADRPGLSFVTGVVPVDDPTDPRLRDYLDLTDVELRRRREPADGLFMAEGEKVIRRALAAGYRMRSLLLEDKWLASLRDVVDAFDGPVYVGARPVLAEVTGYDVHRGALAAMDRRPLPSVAEVLAGCAAGRRARGRQRPHERRRHLPVGCRAGHGRRARHASLRGPALSALGQGVDGRGLLGAVDPPAVLAGRHRAAARGRAGRAGSHPRCVGGADRRAGPGGAGARRPRPRRGRTGPRSRARSPRSARAYASRCPPGSTPSTSAPPPRLRSTR